MKRVITVILSLAPLFASAQEPQIIGGYLLDGKDSFEELDAAVVTDAKRKDKNLDGKGMRLPGGVMMLTPESVGKEIGSLVEVKQPFLVKTISFTVDENRMEGCMYFPVYVKSSYSRQNASSPLTKWKYNIGMDVIGRFLN